MATDRIRAEIEKLARDKLDFDGSLRREMRLVEDLDLDSIRLMTLAMEIEDHFEINIDEADEAAIVTVADLIGLVERKLAA